MNFNKIKWVLGILVVFLLILFTNLIDRHNFRKVRDSITSIYEDRLVAKNLVLELYQVTKEKELALMANDEQYYQQKYLTDHQQIDSLTKDFRETKLVYQEDKTLTRLERAYDKLEQLERQKGASASEEKTEEVNLQISQKIEEIDGYLDILSNIQLDEGKRQMLRGQKATESVQLLTNMEIYVLIALALIIQFIILYQPRKKRKTNE